MSYFHRGNPRRRSAFNRRGADRSQELPAVHTLEGRVLFDATVYTTAADFSRGVYTVDADFDRGIQFNVNHEEVHDQLQLNARLTTFPFMWIANAGEDTISKIDTDTGRQIARYRTWFGPAGQPGYVNHLGNAYAGGAPSRTAVDRDGNVYVANRHFDGRPADVVKILTTGGIDRNGNGVIDTSSDLNNSGIVGDAAGETLPLGDTNNNGIIDPAEIQDERIAWVVRVGAPGALGRSLAIDPNGFIWAGLYNTQQYYKLDPADGSIVAGPIVTPGHNPYGAVVDGNGMLWGASLGNTLLQINTNTNTLVAVHNHGQFGADYGIAIGNGRVYQANQSNNTFTAFNPTTNSFSAPAAMRYSSLGIAVDSQGSIFAGRLNGGGVGKFRPDGSLLWFTGAQAGTGEVRGTVVDSNDDVWLIHRTSANISKYDGATGAPLGVFPVGDQPYTYTDATGLQRFTSTSPSGRWSVVQDSGQADTHWGRMTWNTEPEGAVPDGTQLLVEARAANSQIDLANATFQPFQNGVADDEIRGQFIEVRVIFTTNMQGISPVLSDITVESFATNQPPIITALSTSAAAVGDATEGQSVILSGTFTDVDTDDTHTATIDWGDGTTTAGTVSELLGTGSVGGSHAYAHGGVYDVTLTVVDDAGLSDTRTTRAYITGSGIDPDGTLEIVGTRNRDLLYVKMKNGQLVASAEFLGGWHRWYNPANLTGLLILTGDGHDKVDVYDTVRLDAIIDGGAGDDVLWGGGGRNLMIGGTGSDQVTGGAKEDVLVAGSTVLDGDPDALRGVLYGGNPLAGLTLDDNVYDLLSGLGGADTLHGAFADGGVLDEILYLQEQDILVDMA